MNQLTLSKWALGLFYMFVFFLPFTKLSIPAFGLYELTIADISIILLSFVCIVFSVGHNVRYSIYIRGFVVFIFAISISILMARNLRLYILELVPFLMAFLIVLSTITIFSKFPKLKLLKAIWNILFFSLFLSALPVYFQLITGIKLTYFFSHFGWRYVFLCQNPNQFGIYIILFFFLLSLISIKYFPKTLFHVFVLQVIYVTPVVFSGSRTATLIFAFNFILLGMVLFFKMKPVKKMIVAPLLIVLIGFSLPRTIEFVRTQGGQINRALSIFEILDSGNNNLGATATFSSQLEAIQLFKRYPILGVGMANKPMHSQYKTEIHNTFLKFLAETGIVGFSFFLFIFFLPLLAMLYSRSSLLVKFTFLGFYVLWTLMNIPHMLLRQRWVWFFMVICFIMACINTSGRIEKSRLRFLNV